jgi:hypothetical protein
MIFIKARLDESNLVSLDQKKEIYALAQKASQSITGEISRLNLKSVAGQRTMLLSRARTLQNRLVEASSKLLSVDKKEQLNNLLLTAQKELGLTTTARVKIPPTSTTEENLSLNDKMAAIELTLSRIEG